MKQILMTLLLTLSMLTAAAQSEKDKGAALNERLFNAKVSELALRLEMTDEQKARFEPVYRRYSEEMRALWKASGRKAAAQEKCENCKDQPKTEDPLARTKRRMERQQQAQTVRLRYIDEFATVLTPQQVSRFYEEEGRIQKKLKDRCHHPHGGKKQAF